jgi:hypothetical protein
MEFSYKKEASNVLRKRKDVKRETGEVRKKREKTH